MKRVAIPISNNNLSEYFGGCNYYEIFEIEGKDIQKRMLDIPSVSDVTELPSWLEKQGVTDVIAYKVDKRIISLFASKKVNLFVGIARKQPELLIEDYLNGKLISDERIISELID
ncbi:MAG: hypothetical protein ABFS16_15530 [Bacteroidota bacterium]